MHEPASIADVHFEKIRYGEWSFYIAKLEDGWYHLPAGLEPEEVDTDWAGPFDSKTDAISDGAERIDLANS